MLQHLNQITNEIWFKSKTIKFQTQNLELILTLRKPPLCQRRASLKCEKELLWWQWEAFLSSAESFTLAFGTFSPWVLVFVITNSNNLGLWISSASLIGNNTKSEDVINSLKLPKTYLLSRLEVLPLKLIKELHVKHIELISAKVWKSQPC